MKKRECQEAPSFCFNKPGEVTSRQRAQPSAWMIKTKKVSFEQIVVMGNIEQQIEHLLADKFGEEGFEDCFLIEIKLSPRKKLDVFIDSDSGISFEKCQKISRYLEQHIDASGWLGEAYTLEVSSPGVSRPLKFIRQYPRNVGRTLELELADKSIRTGVLISVSETHLVIEENIVRQEGKKKIKETVQSEIPFDQVQKAIVKISW